MPDVDAVNPRWSGSCVVAASGPSLTQDVADACKGVRTIAVNDAYKLMPWSDIIYAADRQWWKVHEGCPEFKGERWSTRVGKVGSSFWNIVDQYQINVIAGVRESKFSRGSKPLFLGQMGAGNSGFQAVNLALLFGATRIILCGFDMRMVDGMRHFFGAHPRSLNPNQNFHAWVTAFTLASKEMPDGVDIINTTPGSALKCFPFMDLEEALQACKADDLIDA